jgi:hypothetical protein
VLVFCVQRTSRVRANQRKASYPFRRPFKKRQGFSIRPCPYLAPHPTEGITRLAGIGRRTSGINVWAESLGRFITARQVRGARIVGDVPGLLDELVRAGMVPTMTASSVFGPAVEDELDRQVHVISLGVPCDLDPVSEGGECPVCPTTATVLRDVLIEGLGQVTHPVHVAPREGIGQVLHVDVGVRQRRLEVVVDGIVTDLIAGQGNSVPGNPKKVSFHKMMMAMTTVNPCVLLPGLSEEPEQ